MTNMTQISSQDNSESSQRQSTPTPESTAIEREPQNKVEPLLKKPRLEGHEDPDNARTEARFSPFLHLPLELLAEILILTESPKHILAVARSCKFLCATLLKPSSTFIWRTTRKICKPKALPDPFSTFTEVSYASFVFDGGRCEMCKDPTNSIYTSFALKLRLCRKIECKEAFLQRSAERATFPLKEPEVAKCVPRAENTSWFSPSPYPYTYATNFIACFRKTDWFLELYRRVAASSSEEYLANNQSRVKYISEWMEFCITLASWKDKHQDMYLYIQNANETFGKNIAKPHGWEFRDLINCTAYGAMHRYRTRLLELVTERDYESLFTRIDKALVKVSENRKRRDHEAAYQQNRYEVEQHYSRLRSQRPAIILPPLAAFRELPIIAILQASPATAETFQVSRVLQTTQWARDQLDVERTKWVENAKTQLGAILGYPNWKTASKIILHPCDRVTAWFRCKNCPRLPLKNLTEGCLDFAGVCVHECAGMSNAQKRHDKAWDPDKFIKDEKASTVMSHLLGLCGVDGTREETRTLIKKLGSRIICSSCKPPLLMGPESVVGHSHRHDEMKITLLPETGATPKSNFEVALLRQLLGNHLKAKSFQALRVYGCRHCPCVENGSRKCPQTVEDSLLTGNKDKRTQGENQAKHVSQGANDKTHPDKHTDAFTFHGLRSHLHAKHDIKDIRDEDFFCYQPLDWTPVRKATK